MAGWLGSCMSMAAKAEAMAEVMDWAMAASKEAQPMAGKERRAGGSGALTADGGMAKVADGGPDCGWRGDSADGGEGEWLEVGRSGGVRS